MDRKGNDAKSATGQHARFLETARELGADQDEGALDRVFGKVVPPVLPKPADKKEKQ